MIARRYRTVLTEGYREGGVNFGSHYRLVTWMCGAPCAQSALVDARTGRVYEGPIAAMGFSFRANSQLLVVNPPDSSEFATSLFPPEYWVWHKASRQFERP